MFRVSPALRVILGVAIVACGLVAAETAWRSSATVHSCVEAIGTVVLFLAALRAIDAYEDRHEASLLVLASGLSGVATLDGLHAVLTAPYVSSGVPSELSALIPWSWLAGRVVLPTVLIVAWWVRTRELDGKAPRLQPPLAYVTVTVIALAIYALFVFVPMPPAHVDGLLRRPQEVVPAVLFAVALGLFVRDGGSSRTGAFGEWMQLGAAFGLCSSLVMLRSGAVFDGAFDVAHVAKVLGTATLLPALTATSAWRAPVGRDGPAALDGLLLARQRFRGVFVLLAGAVLFSFLVPYAAGTELRSQAEAINETGRQRALAWQVALFSEQLVTQQRSASREGLLAAADGISDFVSADGLEEAPDLRLELLALADAARRLAAEPSPSASSPSLREIRAAGEAGLVERIDLFVGERVGELQQRKDRVDRLSLFLDLVVVLLLGIVGAFIGMPILHRLGDHIDLLREATRSAQASQLRLDAELRQLFELSRDLVCVGRMDGAFIRVNPAFEQVLGFAPDQIEGTKLLELIHADDVATTQSQLDALLRGDTDVRFECRTRTLDGSYRWLAWQGSGLPGDQRFFAIARDMTEQRAVQQELVERAAELERSNKDLESFAYVASHDLKSPLRDIGNLAEWLDEDAEGLDARSREHLARIRQRVLRMTALLEDLLAYARVGRRRRHAERFDLAELLAEIEQQVGVPGDVELRISGPSVELNTPVVPLQQVVRNLLANAVKHGLGDARTVDLTWKVDDAYVHIAVTDHGKGIAPRDQERIFGMFQTLQSAHDDTRSGMGLALARRLARAHQGEVRVASEPGRGATFTVSWPLEWEMTLDPSGVT